MRQISTLPDASQAQLLADYLLTLSIPTRLEQQPEGWAVWVCDEDQVERARQVLAEFLRAPTDPLYTSAQKRARSLRLEDERQEQVYQRKQANLQRQLTSDESPPNRRVTVALLALSLLITFMTDFGSHKQPMTRLFTILPLPVDGTQMPSLLQELSAGQVWRLITPIFLHLGLFHLLFNMYWLILLGGLIESKRGSVRLLVLVLATAIPSNVAQLYFDFSLAGGLHLAPRLNPYFGGMSGVNYGLFGYVWMKSRLQPDQGMMIGTQTVVILMLWFFLCLSGLIGNVANTAHAVGLVVGLVAGLVPTARLPQR